MQTSSNTALLKVLQSNDIVETSIEDILYTSFPITSEGRKKIRFSFIWKKTWLEVESDEAIVAGM